MGLNWDVDCDRCGKPVRGGTIDGTTMIDTVPESRRVAGAEENVVIEVKAMLPSADLEQGEDPTRYYCLKCLRFLLEGAEEEDFLGDEDEPPKKAGGGS